MRSSCVLLAAVSAVAHGQVPARLSGRVTTPDGAAAAAARVIALPQLDPALRAIEPAAPVRRETLSARANARGVFRLALAAGSLYRVYAVAADGASVSALRHSVRAGDRVRLTLGPACRVRLRESEQHPWRGTLAWRLRGFDRDRREEFDLANGVGANPAELPPIAPGRYRLRVRTADARAFEWQLRLRPRERREIDVVLGAAATLELRGSIDGYRTRAPFGHPSRSDDAAKKTMRVPAFSTLSRILLSHDGQSWSEIDVGRLTPGANVAVQLPNPSTRGFALDVRTSDGEPATGRLVLTAEIEGRIHRRTLQVRGTAVLRHLPEARWLALFWEDGGERAARILDPPDGPTPAIRMATAPAASAEISALGADGTPLRRAKLFAFPQTLATATGQESLFPTLLRYPDRRGRFLFAALPPGDYEFRVEAPFHIPIQQRLTVVAGKRVRTTMRLERGSRIHGRVLQPDGKAAPGVLVTMSYPLIAERTAPLEVITDSDGHFLFTGIPDGEFVVEATRAIGVRSELARRRVRAGPKPIELRLRDEDPVRR